MKLLRYGPKGQEKPGLLDDAGKIRDLSGVVKDIDGSVLADLSAIRAVKIDSLPVVAVGVRLAEPVANVGKFICIGLNYSDHAAESGMPEPSEPIIFMKATSAICGPNDDVIIPRNSKKTDWEVELGVVIGSPALYLDGPERAISHVAGFVTATDLSERGFQLEISGGQWSKGKCAPGFSPLGPWLVTVDEVDYANLGLRAWVNGELRQDSTTADMIFTVEELVFNLSQYMALEPGDVILTGTPEGVALSGRFPYLKAGDVVEVEIDGLGRQRQVFAQA